MLRKTTGLAVLVLTLILVGRGGGGDRDAAAAQPGAGGLRVATVNLARLFGLLEEMQAAERQLDAMNRTMIDDRSAREAAAVELEEELATLAPGSRAYIETAQNLLLAQNDLRGYEDYRLQSLDLNRAILIETIYAKVTAAASEIANRGYDLVMIDDSGEAFGYSDASNVPRSVQIERQIGSRVLLHATPTLDVTDELSVFLNNAYRTRREE